MEWEAVRLAMIASGGGMAGATICGAWTAIGISWGKNEETTVVIVRWVIVERATATTARGPTATTARREATTLGVMFCWR